MRLNCVSCGHSLDLHDDYDDYEGQVKCFVCGTLLEIRTEDGRIKSVRQVACDSPRRRQELEVRS